MTYLRIEKGGNKITEVIPDETFEKPWFSQTSTGEEIVLEVPTTITLPDNPLGLVATYNAQGVITNIATRPAKTKKELMPPAVAHTRALLNLIPISYLFKNTGLPPSFNNLADPTHANFNARYYNEILRIKSPLFILDNVADRVVAGDTTWTEKSFYKLLNDYYSLIPLNQAKLIEHINEHAEAEYKTYYSTLNTRDKIQNNPIVQARFKTTRTGVTPTANSDLTGSTLWNVNSGEFRNISFNWNKEPEELL